MCDVGFSLRPEITQWVILQASRKSRRARHGVLPCSPFMDWGFFGSVFQEESIPVRRFSGSLHPGSTGEDRALYIAECEVHVADAENR